MFLFPLPSLASRTIFREMKITRIIQIWHNVRSVEDKREIKLYQIQSKLSLSDLISGTANFWTTQSTETQYFPFHQVIVELCQACQASVNQILDFFFSEESFNFIIIMTRQAESRHHQTFPSFIVVWCPLWSLRLPITECY